MRIREDSESSCQSTTATTVIKEIPFPLSKGPSSAGLTREKHVRFQHHISCIGRQCTDNDSDEYPVQECWYTAAECRRFKVGAYIIAKKVSQGQTPANQGFHMVMSRVYDLCCREEGEVYEEDDDDCFVGTTSILHPKERKMLEGCINNSNSRLGLEKLTVQNIMHDVLHRRRSLWKIMKDFQANEDASNLAEHEALRRRLEGVSRPSCLWALEKARALIIT